MVYFRYQTVGTCIYVWECLPWNHYWSISIYVEFYILNKGLFWVQTTFTDYEWLNKSSLQGTKLREVSLREILTTETFSNLFTLCLLLQHLHNVQVQGSQQMSFNSGNLTQTSTSSAFQQRYWPRICYMSCVNQCQWWLRPDTAVNYCAHLVSTSVALCSMVSLFFFLLSGKISDLSLHQHTLLLTRHFILVKPHGSRYLLEWIHLV